MEFAVLPGIQKASVAHYSPSFMCQKDAVRLVTPKSVWTNGAARQQTCVVQEAVVRRRMSVVLRDAVKVLSSAVELIVVILVLLAVAVMPAAIRTRLAVTIHVVIMGKMLRRPRRSILQRD